MGQYSYEVVAGVARFRLSGEQVLERGVRQIAEAIVRTKEAGLDKLLVDIRPISGVEPPSVTARLWLMGEWARAGRGSVRVAIVTRPEFIDPDRFGIAAGLNAGFSSNVFESEDRALDWLMGRRGGGMPGQPPA